MTPYQEHQELKAHYDAENARRNSAHPFTLALQKIEILESRIARARTALVHAKKGMGGLARISFQKHIDAALAILNEK